MNKEYEKFHRDNPGLIEDLISALDALHYKFEQGIVPGEPLKSDAEYVLDAYINAINIFNKVEAPAFQRIKTAKSEFDEEKIYQELSKVKDGISLLLRLSREKMIDVDDAVFKSAAGLTLLQGHYCDEVIMDESGKQYYSLSEKAEKTFKSKNFMSKIRKENALAVVPNGMILPSEKWSNLYARRIEFLRQYYLKNKEGKEYILFTLDEAKEMVFGCELSDSIDIEYAFAGIFDEKISEQINQLKVLASSGRIDSVIILVESQSMANILEKEGINPKDTPQITIEMV